MVKVISFTVTLVKKILDDDLFSLANELTYKLLLAFFPFMIFLMTVVGFLNLDSGILLNGFMDVFPEAVFQIVEHYIVEVVEKRNLSLLSISLLISLYSASSGVSSIVRGINKIHHQKDTRSFMRKTVLNLEIVLLLILAIIVMVVVIIFGSNIIKMLAVMLAFPSYVDTIIGITSVITALLMLLAVVAVIFRMASCKKMSVKNVMPGVIITVAGWYGVSKVFDIYVNNFARFSRLYGSIAGIFIMIMWLNLISILLLIGNEINAMLIVEE